MLNWSRRVNPCLDNKFPTKYLPKPQGAVVMSYPLSRSPHLSQLLLPLSFSWVKTFEVVWLYSRRREKVNWGARLGGASAPRSATTAAQSTPRARGLPALRMPAEWSPPRAAAATAATAIAAAATTAAASVSTQLWLAGRKCNWRRERSPQWEWSGYIKESKQGQKPRSECRRHPTYSISCCCLCLLD